MVYALLDATEGLGDLPRSFQLQLRIHYYDDRKFFYHFLFCPLFVVGFT